MEVGGLKKFPNFLSKYLENPKKTVIFVVRKNKTMILENNYIELKVGDVFRFNRARKHHKVVSEFEYEGKTYIIIVGDTKESRFEIREKERLCGVYVYYDTVFDGIVELNGLQVRGVGGKLLDTPKPVKEKEKVVETKPQKDLTDFQKFLKVQKSGVINMTDIVRGSRLAGISEEKYTDIIFHYNEYKEGKRQ